MAFFLKRNLEEKIFVTSIASHKSSHESWEAQGELRVKWMRYLLIVHIKGTLSRNVVPSWVVPWKTSPLGSRCTDCHNWGGTRPYGKYYHVRGPPSRFDPKCLMFIDVDWCLRSAVGPYLKSFSPWKNVTRHLLRKKVTRFLISSTFKTWIAKLVIIGCKNSKLMICVILHEPPSTRVTCEIEESLMLELYSIQSEEQKMTVG